jgi:hypothetical protein
MKHLIESGAARIAARIPLGGANFDFEVLSLPGGSVIAALLWLYSSGVGAYPKALARKFLTNGDVSVRRHASDRRVFGDTS